jgi:hypothetical protein
MPNLREICGIFMLNLTSGRIPKVFRVGELLLGEKSSK